MPHSAIKEGDYVLATKYHDGDSKDAWAVGYFDRQEGDRYFVVDGFGSQFRLNGFRRIGKIDSGTGFYLVTHSQEIEQAGCSMWGLVRKLKREARQ